MNPLRQLAEEGQSVWLDYIRRSIIAGGDLERMIEEDGLRGITSNPAIFEKAITGSSDYDESLAALAAERELDAKALYERLAIQDIQAAADLLLPVYAETGRRDGFVSLEVSPHLAHNTEGTIEEARRLWGALGRENVMIKVPATAEGIPAIERLIGEGFNINVTLLFSRNMYERVVEAYLRGLGRWIEGGGDPSRVASVASFFISRIDAAADDRVAKRLEAGASDAERARLRSVMGKLAIANAKLTYRRYKELFSGPRWQALAEKGAQTQRLLWASTSTKNPEYRDVLYVEELIGPQTVTTVPPATYDAFRDHGRVQATLEEDVEAAEAVLATLDELGVSLNEITDRLLVDGVRKFADAFKQLLTAVEGGCRAPVVGTLQRQTYKLPVELDEKVDAALQDWRQGNKPRRLWARDASLWTGGDEAEWLGWLGITEDQLETQLERFRRVAEMVREESFSHVLLLGMGGSSLCPEVLSMTFGVQDGFPELQVLDSTDPAQVRAFEGKIDLERTLFIVSSKSGTTLEPNVFLQHFYARVKERVGAERAGRQFVAISDPGSKLEEVAERDGFRRVFFGMPSIGGRYSALSDFGMVPGAAMGLDIARFLDRTEEMVQACAACVPAESNPGAVLGAVLGVAGRAGRNKVTIVTSPGIRDLGAWLEQLLAESTGKQGVALIPVDREELGPPSVYGDDRLFVYLRLANEADARQDEAVARLEAAAQPLVWIEVTDRYDLGQEFFRWEFATAVAGSILGINPFNQPDVEASKLATRALTAEYEKTGALPAEEPILEGDGLKLFADPRNAEALAASARREGTVAAYLKSHLNRFKRGDYFGLLAYLEMNGAHDEVLQAIRHRVREARRVATCLGYGPRFLHSTGQAYKGGPNSGVFLQITCDDAADLPVPGQKYTFGVVKAAQARGDFEVLAERGRRALRVHLGSDVRAGLEALKAMVDRALG